MLRDIMNNFLLLTVICSDTRGAKTGGRGGGRVWGAWGRRKIRVSQHNSTNKDLTKQGSGKALYFHKDLREISSLNFLSCYYENHRLKRSNSVKGRHQYCSSSKEVRWRANTERERERA